MSALGAKADTVDAGQRPSYEPVVSLGPYDYKLIMHHPRTWPKAVSLMLGMTVLSQIFSISVHAAPSISNFIVAGLVVCLALGVAFFASRLCWLIFSIFALLAFYFLPWAEMIEQFAIVSWRSWVNILLQSAVVALLLSFPIIRWVGVAVTSDRQPR